MATERDVVGHYTHGSLRQAVLDGIAALGREPGTLSADDLAGIDEFHMGGRRATAGIGERLGLAPGDVLLDVGSGLGGPARHFAGRFGCRVAGVDLTPEYVEVAAMLTRLVGLADRAAFCAGSALALPFAGAAFGAATLLHVGMNLADKGAMCAEVARALRPGGVFAVYDVMRMGDGELGYPVAWAGTPQASFLAEPEVYRAALRGAGFEVVEERDRRELALAGFRKGRERKAVGGPALGPGLVMGPDAATKVANMVAGLERGVIAPVEMICRRR